MPAAEPLIITRTLNASKERVFAAWTDPRQLDKWWGPKGANSKTVSFDLRPGGMFHFSMQTPDGLAYGRFIFHEITPSTRLVFENSFADARGEAIRAPFSADWPLRVKNELTLDERDGVTTLTLRGGPIDPTEAEAALFGSMHTSMQGGFGGTFDALEAFLAGE